MDVIENSHIKTRDGETGVARVTSYNMQSFVEVPWKTGPDKPLARIGPFELFNLFTANIIREKVVFTR